MWENICCRFTQHLSWEELQRLADLIGQPRNPQPRYTIAPTTRIEVIRLVEHLPGGALLLGALSRASGYSEAQ